ncbi:unnamed protein product [Moneuplotes crassus]|uniref:PH domain-containing protein n=2 Tax=Euplotes crassus TaxID=5936 RepID=A0AAD1Y715_EUPCR|nr:unnamed protein product [Moneuplotes crassus]
MFEGILEKLLNTYLGKYIEGLNKESLSVGVWKGDINLQNVKVRSDALDEFKLPFKLIYGEVGKLQVKVPWRSLSSQPVIVVLESLYLIITPQMKKEWEIIDFNNYEDKLRKLVTFGESIQDKIKNEKSDDDNGYFSKLSTKILDNIQITVKNIHIRFEDSINASRPYSFGFTLKELSAQTCNQQWEYEYYDRTDNKNKDMPVFKLLLIEKFAFYWEANEEGLASEECNEQSDMHDFMEVLFPIDSTHIEDYNYIIEPICLKGKLKQISKIKNEEDAKFSVNIEVDNFSVKLQKYQYDSICKLAEVVGEYSKFQMLANSTKKFKFLRPIRGINSFKRENVLHDTEIMNENAVMWWKYAIKSVIKQQREKRGSMYEFRIPKSKKREYEVNFINQFQLYLKNEDYDQDMLHHIIVAVDRVDLERWVTVITKMRIDDEEHQKNEAGWFGFFKQKNEENKNDVLSSEEIDNMYQKLTDKFLENEDKEEIKDPSEIKNIELSVLVKKGGLNLIYNAVDIDLYFHHIGFNLKQYGNQQMVLDAQTRNFGLKMDSDQHFEIIEKMDESEVFWEMTYLKNPVGSEIEHSLNLTINPIKMIYEGSFIKTLVKFFKNETDLQIKEQATEKWADFKDGAGAQIQESIKAGGKEIKICIYSPILLIPLIKNDPNSEMWAINLGNFVLESETPQDQYECYTFRISSMMMKFYKNYETWAEIEREAINQRKLLKDSENLYYSGSRGSLSSQSSNIKLDHDHFTLLEEFQIGSKLAVNTGHTTPVGRGEVEIIAKISPVKFNLNDEIYNHVVNIHRCFAYEDPEEIVQGMILEKEKVMKKAKLISIVKKRGSNIKIFAKRYAIISGNYVYFYRETSDLLEEDNMFLKDAVILDISDKVGEKHALEIKSKFGEVIMAFNTKQDKDKWRCQIQKITIELNTDGENREEVALKEIEQKQKEINAKLFYFDAKCPKLKATWYEADGASWMSAHINDVKFKINKPVDGVGVYLGAGSGQVYYHSDIPNLDIVLTSQKPQTSSNNFLEVDVQLNENPQNPQGDEIRVDLKVGYLKMNYYPPFINNAIRRFRKVKYIYECDEEKIKLGYKDRIQAIESQIIKQACKSEDIADIANEFIKNGKAVGSSHNCEKFPFPYIIVRVALLEVEGDFLHHLYATPFAKITIGETKMDFDMYVDYDELKGSLGGIRLYDLTNYPYTLDPRDAKTMSEKAEKFEIIGLRNSEEKNTLSFECQFFTDLCPKKPEKRKSKIKLYVASINYVLQFDYLMRFKDYFFDRFLESVTDTNPYEEDLVKENIDEKLIKFNDSQQVSDFDLKQEDEIIDLHVEVKNPCIILRARNHYKEEFSIFLGNIHVTSEMITEKGKWHMDPYKTVRLCSFQIGIEETTLYHCDGEIGSCKFFFVNFKQLLQSDTLEYIDPLALNKSLCLDLEFSPIDVKISKRQFTYLMKCLDLNINYDDGMKDLYDFKLKKDFIENNPIQEDHKIMAIKIKMPCISLSCYFLKEFLAEIVCQDFKIDIDRFVSTKNLFDLSASAIWAFGEESKETGHKQVIIGPYGCSNSVYTDESFYKFDKSNAELKKISLDQKVIKCMNTIVKMHNGEKEITTELQELKCFTKIHIFMLLFHFFTEGLPKYDPNDRDLPNQFDDDVENAPRLSFELNLNKSLICLDDLKNVIAINLDLCFVYNRYHIKSLKNDLLNQILSKTNTQGNSHIAKSIRFNITNCNPYFCKYEDLAGDIKWKKIKKREIIKPFALCYSSKTLLERYETDSFRYNLSTDILVEPVAINMSINQIVSLYSMIQNTSSILKEKYTDKIKKDIHYSQEPASSSSHESKESLFGNSQIFERTGIFKETYEVFANRYNKVPNKKITDQTNVADQEEDKLAVASKAENANMAKSKNDPEYFDQELEEVKFSPEEENNIGKDTFTFFLQGLDIFFINDHGDNSYPVICCSLKDTNYSKENLKDGSFQSQALVDASFDYYNIKTCYWEPFIEGLEIEFQYDKQLTNSVIQVKGKDSLNLNISPDFVTIITNFKKSWDKANRDFHLQFPKKEELKKDLLPEEAKEAISEEFSSGSKDSLSDFIESQNAVESATPYKIENYTGSMLFVETLFDKKKDKYILKDCTTTKIAISYEKQTIKNYSIESSKMNDNVKILFEGIHLPIEKISLNKLNTGIHKLTDIDEINDFIFFETKVVETNKVLTLRTQNLLVNSTQFSYDVVIMNPTNRKDSKQVVLKPGEKIPFPSSMKSSKISLKKTDDDNFSNFIPAKRLIYNTAVNYTNYIKSGDTFTMVRKEINKTHQKCFDIHLIPPIRIKNGLPVKMTLKLLNIGEKYVLEKSEEKHLNYYSPDEIIQVSVKLEGYDEDPIQIKFLKKSYDTSFKLSALGSPSSVLNLYANFSDSKAGCFITFYVKTCFVNASSFPLKIFDTTKNKEGIFVPGQKSWKNITLASDIDSCCFLLDEKSVSEEINVEGGSINGQFSIAKNVAKELSELVYTTRLSLIDLNMPLYTKIITILPKYVIINKTDKKLLLTQKGLEQDFTIIDSRSREIFSWLEAKAEKKALIKMLDSSTEDPLKEWKWSSPFILEEMGTTSVRNLNANKPGYYFYWKIDRCIQNSIIFITIQEEEDRFPLYKIENKARDVILKYRQKGAKTYEFCQFEESKRFAWDKLYDKHKVDVEAWIESKEKKTRLCRIEVEFDVMEKSDEHRYDLRNMFSDEEIEDNGFTDVGRVLNYRTHTNGYTKCLVFDDTIIMEEEDETEYNTPDLIVNLELEGLGISLISDGNPDTVNERREVLYCSLKDIQAILIDFKTERKIQLRVSNMQFDNQFSIETAYPVTLFSQKSKMNKDKEVELSQPFFNLNIVYCKDIPDVVFFKKIEFLIQRIIICVDGQLMMNMFFLLNSIMDTTKTTFTGISEIFVDCYDENTETMRLSITQGEGTTQKVARSLINKVPDWKTEDLVGANQHVYVKQYNSSPLDLIISFFPAMQQTEGNVGFKNFLSRFGVVLTTIENAPININAVEVRDMVGNLNDIIYVLKDRYMSRLKTNLFRVLGASNLIGNPIQLVNNVSTGFRDFFYKPVEGFVEGPLEGGKGIAKGTKSLLQHTVKGTFSSASGIFGSLSKGALIIANDKDYMNDREKNAHNEKPKNTIEGIGMGLSSAAKSFGSGVTGIWKMPTKGAKSKGIKGFFSGTLKGVTGLVAKPVAGAMDFVSKTSEGIKNHATNEDEKIFNKERLRLPRVFYSKERIYKPFDFLHSFAFAYLFKNKRLTMSDPFVDANIVSRDPIQILVLFEKKMFKIKTSNEAVNKSHSSTELMNEKGVSMCIPLQCLKKVEKQKGMLVLTVENTNRKLSKIKIEIESSKVQDKIYSQIHEIYS